MKTTYKNVKKIRSLYAKGGITQQALANQLWAKDNLSKGARI